MEQPQSIAEFKARTLKNQSASFKVFEKLVCPIFARNRIGMYLVSELSVLCNVPVQTIRYYEKYGLIKPISMKEKPGRLKYYDEESLEKLELIEEGKQIGLSLSEIKELMRAWYSQRISVTGRVSALEYKLDVLREKELKLKDVMGRIELLIDELKKFI